MPIIKKRKNPSLLQRVLSLITKSCSTVPVQGHALIVVDRDKSNLSISATFMATYDTMIRKNLLLCKIFSVKNSSSFLFKHYMAKFVPELETCPICGCKGKCHIHDYYARTLIDSRSGENSSSSLCVMRVYCDNCDHAHAVLPDIIIPYSRFSLFFILRVLGEYFAKLYTAEKLCEKYEITQNQLQKWLSLWKKHKSEWLGLLSDSETSDHAFMRQITALEDYSSISMRFVKLTSHSFMQSHRNPMLVKPKNAVYCQTVFEPDHLVV